MRAHRLLAVEVWMKKNSVSSVDYVINSIRSHNKYQFNCAFSTLQIAVLPDTMSKNGPIILIEDDPDDQEMIYRILSRLKLPNEIKRFRDGEQALDYFLATDDKPLVILCDINMPLMNGIELKQNIESNEILKKKTIPFVYLTTTASPEQIVRAYSFSLQGFFVKGQTYDDLRDTLTKIVTYWVKSEHPA